VLDLIREQDLSEAKVQIVMNRVERKLFGSINLRDAATALRRPVSFTVTNDFWLMSTALDQGVMLAEVKAKNRIGRDLETLIQGIDTVLAERS
jgi:pilus assembly protein CpaE